MTEQRPPEPNQPIEPRPAAKELLNIENYGAVYGRLLFATQLSVEDGFKILNPSLDVPSTPNPFLDETKVRDYNPFVEPLSTTERKDAWEGRNLNEARVEWGSKFKAAITNPDKTDRIAVIKALTGKDAAHIKDEDVDEIYNKYCKKGSDITAYVEDVITGFTENGTINHEEIKRKIAEIQWVASKLFGTKSSEITVIIANLEVIIRTQQEETITKFYKTSGLNDLKEPGKKLLQIFKPETTAATPARPGPASAAPPAGSESDEDFPAAPPATDEPTLSDIPVPPVGQKYLDHTTGQTFEILSVDSSNALDPQVGVKISDGLIVSWSINQLQKYLDKGELIAAPSEPEPAPAAGSEVQAAPPEPDVEPPATDENDEDGEAYIDPELLKEIRERKEQEAQPTPSAAPIPRAATEGPFAFSADPRRTRPESTDSLPKIAIEGDPKNFIHDLNETLAGIKDKSPHVLNLPIDTIKEFLITSATGKDTILVNEGSYQVDELNNQITINGLTVNGKGKAGIGRFSKEVRMNTTLALLLSNSTNVEGDIDAELIDNSNFWAEGKVKDGLKKLNQEFRDNIKTALKEKNEGWVPEKIRIEGKRILVEFKYIGPIETSYIETPTTNQQPPAELSEVAAEPKIDAEDTSI